VAPCRRRRRELLTSNKRVNDARPARAARKLYENAGEKTSFKNILYRGLIATAVILINSCEEPLSPDKSAWREITAIPYYYYELEVASPRGVYLTVGEEGVGEKLVFFEGDEFKEEYAVLTPSDSITDVTLPPAWSNAGFMAITR
jgi:hypothetical protein